MGKILRKISVVFEHCEAAEDGEKLYIYVLSWRRILVGRLGMQKFKLFGSARAHSTHMSTQTP